MAREHELKIKVDYGDIPERLDALEADFLAHGHMQLHTPPVPPAVPPTRVVPEKEQPPRPDPSVRAPRFDTPGMSPRVRRNERRDFIRWFEGRAGDVIPNAEYQRLRAELYEKYGEDVAVGE